MVDQITPVSTGQKPTDSKKHTAVSPAETSTSFPDEKNHAATQTTTTYRVNARTVDVESVAENPSLYKPAPLPDRPQKKPFWRRNLLWLLSIFFLVVIFIGILVGVTTHHYKKAPLVHTIPNATLHSVASSGLFLNDKKTWNMQTFWQNTTGGINLQMSLNGRTFEPARMVALNIVPKVGSPMSATAAVDPITSLVMLNLFYISDIHNISMSTITCPANSTHCNTILNCYLPTTTAPNDNTGLAAVSVDDDQGWRVYYYDAAGLLNELVGNSSGFDMGEPIGGSALNGSDIAAANVNSTTNNINIFYVDQLTEALFTLEFANGTWTEPTTISPDRVVSWNPLSGLGAAYSNTTDQLHVYYTGLDEGIYEFLGSNASTTNTVWAAHPGRNHIWATADYMGADITAVGWLDQVRFFQISQNKMVEGILRNRTWTETFAGSVAL